MAVARILVVEDEGIVAKDIESRLKKFGYSVAALAASGEDAVRKAEETRPDLALMDIMLKGEVNGIEAAERIRESLGIPVIYLTAFADESTLQRAKLTEPFGYILKPFEDKELRIAIEVALYKHGMEKKLRESQAEAMRVAHLASLGELAAGVAHEINNPLNGIINYAQMLANRFQSESAPEKDIARRIIKEGDRIAGIVKSLLSFARYRKEGKTPVSVISVLSDSLSLAGAQMAKEGIDMDVDISPELEINANPQQIQQVFLNVINNARYALNQKNSAPGADKSIEITGLTVQVEGAPYVRVVFHDRGLGIPKDALDKVMNPFFSTKPSGMGTGLGLSICHGIIKDHGGAIRLESVEGEYTKVIIDLPARVNGANG